MVLTLEPTETVVLDKTVWEEAPFGIGASISREEIEELCRQSARRRAENKAVFLLSRRDHSRRELEEKLCREKGRYHPESRQAAAQAVAHMAELGYVNDEAYARRLAERYVQIKLYPRRRAVEALCQKGIDRETAGAAVSELKVDETELALAFLRKKRYTVPQSTDEWQRIAAAMARYGYGSETIRRALALWQGADE